MGSGDDIKLKADQACSAAEEFTKRFYDALDKRRHQILAKLYLESGTFVWNGNCVTGHTEIAKFLDGLPNSEHTVDMLDAQPILSEFTGGQTTIMITTGGTVKFSGHSMQMFNQNFILIAQNNNWKVASCTFRSHS